MNFIKMKANVVLLYLTVAGFLMYGFIMEPLENPPLFSSYFYLGLLGLAGLKILCQRNTWKEWILAIVLLLVGVCSYRNCGDKVSLLIMVCICFAGGAELEKLIRLDLLIRLAKTIAYLILPFMGVIPNHIAIEIGGRPRTFFGWEHPNGMGMCFVALCVDYIYIRHGKMKWYDYISILFLAWFLNVTSNVRTGAIVIVGMLLLEIFFQFTNNKIYNICKIYLAGAVGIFLVNLGLFFVGIWGATVMEKIMPDSLFTATSRFILTNRFLELHGWTLFGSPFIDSNHLDYLDMLFPSVLLHRGILFGILFLLIFVYAIFYAYQRRDERYLFVLIVMLAYALMENAHMNLIYTIFPMLLGIPLWGNNEKSNIFQGDFT